MKGNQKLIETLNSLLSDELTAINQYMVHAEIAENWGYDKLGGKIQKRSIDEMKHAEKLISRILFLEGMPIVSNYKKINIGAEVPKQLDFDHTAEEGAIKSYNDAIKLAVEVGDNATKELLDAILKDEDKHIDDIENMQDEIKHMGLAVFLSTQL